MIITWLTGGLGNQMFQYAAGLALAERHRTVLKLDTSWFRDDPAYEAHNRYALSCLNVTEQFATEEEIGRVGGLRLTRTERWSARLARALRLYRYAAAHSGGGHRYSVQGFRYRPGLLEQPDPTYLHGMWQSEKYFAPAADLLRLHFSFRYPPTPAVAEAAERIRRGPPSVAVNFRRGDYARNPVFQRELGVIGPDYYRRAVDLVRERHPDAVLYVVSDDIDAVEREFRPSLPAVFLRASRGANAHDGLRLMSLCDHAIVSNSTFAWWAAWLNPNPAKTVVAPDPWFADPERADADIIPESWIRLPRDGGAR